MVNLPDIFTKSITLPTFDSKNNLNKKFWLKIESGSSKGFFFIIKKLTKEESDKVTKGLNYPSKFYFSDYGNIQGSTNGSDTFVILHSLRINDIAQTADSLEQLTKKHENQFKYDYNNVITQDLKFILHKKNDIWYILYNPIHRQDFKKYYENLIKSPNAKAWAGTTDSSFFIDTTTLFRNYCKSFVVNKDPSFPKENAYMDPVCNMILSPNSCAENAFFGVNLSEYSYNKNTFKEVINTFTSKQKGVEPCLAWGPSSNFINESPLDSTNNNSTSFITKFRNRDKYDSTMELNVCNSEISTAGDANLDGVNIQNTCGGGGVGSVNTDNSLEDENNTDNNKALTIADSNYKTYASLVAENKKIIGMVLVILTIILLIFIFSSNNGRSSNYSKGASPKSQYTPKSQYYTPKSQYYIPKSQYYTPKENYSYT